MADSVGFAVLEVTPSLKGISKDLNKQFVGPAQSAGKRAGSMLGDALKGAAKGAGIAAGAVLATSLTKGFQRLTAIEDAEAKLKGLGNSAGDTAKILDNALAAVKGTAFGMDEAATTAASAVAAGLKPGKDLQNYLGLVGDAATIAGTSMADMGGIFNKVMTSGKVQGDVFAQLGDQGIPVVQMLAETMGVSAEEVYKMGSAGEISSEQFLTAMGKMKGAALEGGNTTTGALKNLYAALGRLGAGLLGGMFPHFKTALNQMTTWVDSLEEKLTPLADTIGQKLGTALGAVVGWLSKLDFSSFQNFASSMGGSGVFDSIGDSLNRLKPAMVAIVGALPEIGTAAVEIAAGGIKLLAAGLSFLADHVNTIVKFAPLIVAGFIAWRAASVALTFTSQKLAAAELAALPFRISNNALRIAAARLEWNLARAQAASTGTTAANTTAVAANNTAQGTGLLARARVTAAMVGQRIALIATTAATWASTVATRALGAALRFAMGPIGWIITGVAALAAGLTWFFTKTETGKKVWESLMGALKSAWGWLKDVFAKVWDTISNAAGAAFGFIKDHWQTLLTIFGGPLGIAIAQVSKHWDTIKNAASTAFGWIGDKVGWVVDKIGVFIDVVKAVGRAVSGIWSGDAFGTAAGTGLLSHLFGEGGADFIVGAIQTVKGAFDGFSAALSATWTNVIQPVLSFIGDAFKFVWDGIVLGAKLVWATLEVGWNFLTIIYENVIAPVLSVIGSAFKVAWDGIVLGAKLVWATLQVGWNFLQIIYDTVIQPVLSAIGWAFQRLWDGIKLGARLVGATFQVAWTGLRIAYDSIIAPVLSWIGARFQDLWNGVRAVADWIGDKWNWLFNNVISPVAGFIADAVGAAGRAFKDLYDTYVAPVVDWIRDKIDFMTGLFTGIKDKVVGALSDAGSWLWNAGKNIVQGLLDGAGSLLSTIGNFFLDKIPGWIKDPFKKALGIHSPSRVFAGFGENIGQGLVDGIDRMSGKVASAAEGIGKTAVDAAQGVGDIALSTEVASPAAPLAPSTPTQAVQAPQIPAVPVPDPAVATQAWTDAGTGLQTATTTLIDPAVQQVNMGVTQFQTESQNLAATVLPAWNTLGAGLATAKTSLIDPVVNGVTGGVRSFGATTAGQLGSVVTPAWNAMATGVANLKAAVIDPMQAGLRADMGATAGFTQQQTLGVMVPAWQQTGSSIWAVQNGAIDPALAATRGAVANTQSAFAQGTSGIINEWDRLREGTAAPVRFTIGTVFNSGLVGMWNSVADMIGTKKMAEYPLRFARGGVMPGYTPGRDVHRFVSPTGGALELSGGEAIMRPEWTRAVGGPSAVDQMNRDARSGRVRHRSPKSAYNYTDNPDAFANGGVVQRFANGGIVESMRRTMAARFPMLQLTSGLRFTDNGYHSKGMAADFSNSTGPSTPQMQAAAAWIFRNFRRQTIQLIHHPSPFNIGGGAPAGDGMGYYGGGTMSEHQNHVHWAVNSPVSPDGTGAVPEGFVAGATSVSPEEMLRMFTDEHIKKTEAAIKGYKGTGGFIDELPAKTWDTMRGAAEKKMITAFNEMGGGDPGGEGAERWRPMMIQALMRQGLGHWAKDKSIVDRFIRQIWTESKGDPGIAQQIVDMNGTGEAAGVGLGQMIPTTWASNRDPSLPDDRRNPWAMLNAMARYVRNRYGENGYTAIGNGIGYDSGGVLKPTPNGFGTYFNHTGKPEAVLTNDQWRNISLLVVNLAKIVDPLRVFAKTTRDVSGDVKTIATNSAKQVREQVSSAVWAALPSEVKGAMVIADAAGRSWNKVSTLIQGKAEAWARGEWPIGSGRKVKEGVTDDRADFVGWKEVTLDTDLVQVAGWNMLAAQKVANNQMKPGNDPAANAIYDVFGRAPILPDLIRIGSMGPNAIDAATDAAIEAFETGDTARLEEWTHSTSQLTEAIMRTRDATIATGQMVKGFMNGFLNWAMASEEHGRQGSWQEYFAHYGGEYGTKEGDWLLSQFGFGGIVGGKFKDSFANLLIETAQSPLLSAPPILDEEGRVIGTQLQKQQDQAAVSPTVLPESGTTTSVLPEVAPEPVTEAKSQEIQVTVELPEGKSAFTAEEVKGMLTKLDDDVDAIKIEVKGLKNESAAVTSGVSLMV